MSIDKKRNLKKKISNVFEKEQQTWVFFFGQI